MNYALVLHSRPDQRVGHLVYDVRHTPPNAVVADHFPEAPACHIDLLQIAPKFQRQGHGTFLIHELMASYPNFAVTLYSLPSAIPFYERLGFIRRPVKGGWIHAMIRKP